MAKLKIKINAPEPSLETIRSYRDFDGLLNNYRKYYSTNGIRDMLYNDRKKLVYIVLVILFLLLLLFVDDIAAQTNVEKPTSIPETIGHYFTSIGSSWFS